VLAGRDVGTVIRPDATYKLFVIASDPERARRRFEELRARGGRRGRARRADGQLVRLRPVACIRECDDEDGGGVHAGVHWSAPIPEAWRGMCDALRRAVVPECT
jgi:hypothetical protein